MLEEGVDRPAAAGCRDGESLGDRGRDQLGVMHRAQGNKVDTVRELVQDFGRDFQAQACLAGAARPGEGQ